MVNRGNAPLLPISYAFMCGRSARRSSRCWGLNAHDCDCLCSSIHFCLFFSIAFEYWPLGIVDFQQYYIFVFPWRLCGNEFNLLHNSTFFPRCIWNTMRLSLDQYKAGPAFNLVNFNPFCRISINTDLVVINECARVNRKMNECVRSREYISWHHFHRWPTLWWKIQFNWFFVVVYPSGLFSAGCVWGEK